MKHTDQQPCHTRHDKKLRTGSYQYIQGTTYEDAKVIGRKRQSHGEHDEAQNDSLCSSTNPPKKVWNKKGKYSNGDNEK